MIMPLSHSRPLMASMDTELQTTTTGENCSGLQGTTLHRPSFRICRGIDPRVAMSLAFNPDRWSQFYGCRPVHPSSYSALSDVVAYPATFAVCSCETHVFLVARDHALTLRAPKSIPYHGSRFKGVRVAELYR